MPLSPAPLPGLSPLPAPGQRPPDPKALRIGALVALPVLLVSLVLGQVLLPRILFLAPGLQADAGGGHLGTGAATFQGFDYPWSRRDGNGGYQSPASLQNMQTEASTYHMNSVIIPVIADMPIRSGSELSWHSGDANNKDTLPDADYEKAITDARAAGLVPILELQVRQQDFALNPGDESPTRVGQAWFSSNASIFPEGGGDAQNVVDLERDWFNAYTDFAVHYAQLSAKHHLPYFIIGDQLSNVTWDTDTTSRKSHPENIDVPPGDPEGSCTGRRDCEWRHLIHAVQASTFDTLASHQAHPGGGYSGKLMYAANWTGAEGRATNPEFEQISWWDAVTYIGVDAFFPLTQNADVSPDALSNAWHGQGPNLVAQGPQANIYGRLGNVADKFNRHIVFTAAGYESIVGSNTAPGHSGCGCADDLGKLDTQEQVNDVTALLTTFQGTPWWSGVFWYADYPVAPRSSQANWKSDTSWAGDTIDNSKPAGIYLSQYYHKNPIPCGC